MPTLAIRTTCSEAIGLGHYRRCLTLAQEAAKTTQVVFIVAADERGREIVRADGFPTELIDPGTRDPEATLALVDELGADALVVDDYALTPLTIAALHARVPKLLVLDDGGRRILDVDVVLDANPAAPGLGYDVPAGSACFLGARYALLRPEFRGMPPRRVRAEVERVCVTLGGSNPGGRAGPIAETLLAALPGVTIELVAGPLFKGHLPEDERLVVHRSPRSMVDLMLRADLAVTAGGQTIYELAACGVPMLAICVAENQRANLIALAKVPALRIAADDSLASDVLALASDPASRQQLADHGQALVDGRGAERAWRELAVRWFGGTA